MANNTDPRIPDATTEWVLWHHDTFDRDTPATVERRGTGILQGLYELWKSTLSEGITDAGDSSFSHFQLTWGETASRRADAGVQPFDNASLLKLRRWANFSSQNRTNALSHEPYQQNNSLLRSLARVHCHLLQESDRWTAEAILWSAEARQLLARVESITDPLQLETLFR